MDTLRIIIGCVCVGFLTLLAFVFVFSYFYLDKDERKRAFEEADRRSGYDGKDYRIKSPFEQVLGL